MSPLRYPWRGGDAVRRRVLPEIAPHRGRHVVGRVLHAADHRRPTLVLRADYWDSHELELTWEWVYRLGDNEFRALVGSSPDAGYRDLDAETRLAAGIDAPL